MSVRTLDKQRRAVNVVKTTLLSAGISDRSICVGVNTWVNPYGKREDYSVFVSSAEGTNEKCFFVTGKTIVEAVKNMIDSIKDKTRGANADDQSEVAPF